MLSFIGQDVANNVYFSPLVMEPEAAVFPPLQAPGGGAAWKARDYLNRVMRKSPPTAKKPMPDPSASVIAIAVPPSKANAPTTEIVDRLTLPRKRLDRS